jgi:hypothetical protein
MFLQLASCSIAALIMFMKIFRDISLEIVSESMGAIFSAVLK